MRIWCIRADSDNDTTARICVLDEDEEQFEDNPEEYIRRDIEGSGEKITLTTTPSFLLPATQPRLSPLSLLSRSYPCYIIFIL